MQALGLYLIQVVIGNRGSFIWRVQMDHSSFQPESTRSCPLLPSLIDDSMLIARIVLEQPSNQSCVGSVSCRTYFLRCLMYSTYGVQQQRPPLSRGGFRRRYDLLVMPQMLANTRTPCGNGGLLWAASFGWLHLV